LLNNNDPVRRIARELDNVLFCLYTMSISFYEVLHMHCKVNFAFSDISELMRNFSNLSGLM